MTTLDSLLPGTRDCVIQGASEFNGTELDRARLCNLFELVFALVSFRFARYTVLTSPSKDETAVHGYGTTIIGSCRTQLLRLLTYVVSALQLCLYLCHAILVCAFTAGGTSRILGLGCVPRT